jgi:hypothetical protein
MSYCVQSGTDRAGCLGDTLSETGFTTGLREIATHITFASELLAATVTFTTLNEPRGDTVFVDSKVLLTHLRRKLLSLIPSREVISTVSDILDNVVFC